MTKQLNQFSQAELTDLDQALTREFELIAANKLSLNLSRGKPAVDQLALSDGMENVIQGSYIAADGTDTRNYGTLRGLPEARELGSELLGVPAENIIAGGNSSLFLMNQVVSSALHNGLWGDQRRWSSIGQPKILAPVPGYDRHFALTEAQGIGMCNIPMTDAGPDMERALELVRNDTSIKGIWCVPKYSNPTGCTYSKATVEAMAALPAQAAADDFIVLWDNAYAVHDLRNHGDHLGSIFDAANQAGTGDHVVQFASTSKITYAGGGIAFVASSEKVLASLEHALSFMMIGPDKVNQLRHARFLGGRLREHMQAHADILRPKFEIVQSVLNAELGGLGIAEWTNPSGGYFVSLNLLSGLATEVVEMARGAGLTLTPAGATFPYGKDPEDSNVRIAPTFASLDELQVAMQVLVLCVKLASIRKMTKNKF